MEWTFHHSQRSYCAESQTRVSDNRSLRDGWRVNVLKESAVNALARMKSANIFVKPTGDVVADIGVDGDLFAGSAVGAEGNVSHGLLGKKGYQ